jgi:hypothetical protein
VQLLKKCPVAHSNFVSLKVQFDKTSGGSKVVSNVSSFFTVEPLTFLEKDIEGPASFEADKTVFSTLTAQISFVEAM